MAAMIEELVRRFYHNVWNQHSADAARQILHPEFDFRGSLDSKRSGPDGFIAYMDEVHAALAEYTCTIIDLIAEGERAAARLNFKGIHQAPFFGVAATGKVIEWTGAAFFSQRDNQIGTLYVLGDIDAVKSQLGLSANAQFET